MCNVDADFPADVANESGDEQSGGGVALPQSGEDADKPERGAGGGQRIEPGVLGVGDEDGGVDPAPMCGL